MSFWTAIILVVLIVAISPILRGRRAEPRRPGLLDEADTDRALPSAREQELEREVEELRERIQVLERIATEGRETDRLAEEIEKLRDN